MKIVTGSDGKKSLTLNRSEWELAGLKAGWLEVDASLDAGDVLVKKAEGGWPKKLKKGRFTTYCKSQGFEGPCKACAEKALQSDDSSVRGMASFYMNTVKP